MIHIHIEAENALDLRKQLQELLSVSPSTEEAPSCIGYIDGSKSAAKAACLMGEWNVPDAPAEIPTNEDGSVAFRKYTPVVQPEPKPEPEVPVAQPEPEPEPAEPCPKMEECRAALNALRAKHGPGAVRVILTNHGVKSFVELDATDYAKVMREAENYGN